MGTEGSVGAYRAHGTHPGAGFRDPDEPQAPVGAAQSSDLGAACRGSVMTNDPLVPSAPGR